MTKGKPCHPTTLPELEKEEAKERLKLHLNWAHTRERGFYHTKRDKAIKCTQKTLSISMDGTDRFPQFWQVSKQDAKGKRFYFHTQVCIVHGVGPSVYLALEDIAGDPNWTVETLQDSQGRRGAPWRRRVAQNLVSPA